MKLCTITHDASGCRITHGDGIVHVYANATYLAEALAREQSETAELRRELERVKGIIKTTTPLGTADEFRAAVLENIAKDIPF